MGPDKQNRQDNNGEQKTQDETKDTEDRKEKVSSSTPPPFPSPLSPNEGLPEASITEKKPA